MIDTLRADHVGCYGYTRPTTPSLDLLARDGVRFADFHTASPWTMPSVMTMFTSLHPTVHGATSPQRRASLKVRTLAERLKDLGYTQTAAITSNPMVNSRYGFAQGFDLYDDYTIFFAHELNLFGEDDVDQRKSISEAVTSHTVTRMASEWLGKHGRNGPWFLFLLYFDPHDRYVPPAPWDRKFDPHPDAESRKRTDTGPHLLHPRVTPDELEHAIALYDGEIGYTDHCIGQLLAKLEALTLRDNTLVLVTSDHGEEFLDHGGVRHGHTLYDELTRGILILRQPGTLPAGKVVAAPASHLDITPTLLDCIGEKPDPECQGVSRLAAILGKTPERTAPEPIFLEATTKEPPKAVVLGRHKLVLDTASRQDELYDLESDPGEKTNVAAKHPDLCAKLREILDAHVSQCVALAKRYHVEGDAARPQLTRRDIDALRQLGYLQ